MSGLARSDAAARRLRALGAALTAPPGTYDVVDGAPLTRAELAAAQARAVGRRTLRSLPSRLLALGGPAAEPMTRSHRVSGAAFRAATGWHATVGDAAAAWARVARVTRPEQGSVTTARSV